MQLRSIREGGQVAEERETRVDNATRLTGIIRGADLPANDPAPFEQAPAADPVVYKKEPLFSRRVLIGWALGTLVVWFGLTVIVPAIVESVKTAIVSSVPDEQGTRTIVTRNGTTITIRKGPDGGITVDRRGPGSAAPAAPEPVTPVIPAKPAEPAAGATAEPAPPAPALTPTEKK